MPVTYTDDASRADRILEHLALLCAALVLNVGMVWYLNQCTVRITPVAATPQALVTVFVRQEIVEASPFQPPPISTVVLELNSPPMTLPGDLTDIRFPVARNPLATIAAPSLDTSPQVSMAAYVRESGLAAGHGATVVLRIEVRESGQPGEIQIETSSGSHQIDQAAIDYARTQRWYAGRIDGEPSPMWVRWAVHLQA